MVFKYNIQLQHHPVSSPSSILLTFLFYSVSTYYGTLAGREKQTEDYEFYKNAIFDIHCFMNELAEL